ERWMEAEQGVVCGEQVSADGPVLMIQWHDPVTGKRKSQSAGTNNPLEAERRRADKEYELNHGLHKEVSNMSWAKFRATFETEYVAGARANTQLNYTVMFDLFERLCSPTTLRSVTERTVSRFAAALRQEPGRRKGGGCMLPSTIRVRLQFLHTALRWAVKQKLLPEVPAFPSVKVPKKDPQPVP